MSDILKNIVNSKVADATVKKFTLENIIPELENMLISVTNESANLNQELGKISKSTGEFKKNLVGLSVSTGASTDNLFKMSKEASNFHKILDDNVSKSIMYFTQSSNASISSTSRLATTLDVLGKTGSDASSSIFKSMKTAQNSYGLTGDQISKVSDILIDYATAVDYSDSSIVKATGSLSVFMSKLTAVGFTAEEVSGFVNNMIDPDKAVDNIALFSKLGYTMRDITMGDPVAMLEDSLPRLKALSQDILSSNNRIQQQAIAKAYGLTLAEVNKYAAINLEKINTQQVKSLETARNQMLTITTSFDTAKNMVVSGLSNTITVLYDSLNDSLKNKVTEFVTSPSLAVSLTGLSVIAAGSFMKHIKNRSISSFALAGKSFRENSGIDELIQASAIRKGSYEKTKNTPTRVDELEKIKSNELFSNSKYRVGRRDNSIFKTLKKESVKVKDPNFYKDESSRKASQKVFTELGQESSSMASLDELKGYLKNAPSNSYNENLLTKLNDAEDRLNEERTKLANESFYDLEMKYSSVQKELLNEKELANETSKKIEQLKRDGASNKTIAKTTANLNRLSSSADKKSLELERIKEELTSSTKKSAKEINEAYSTYKKMEQNIMKDVKSTISTGEISPRTPVSGILGSAKGKLLNMSLGVISGGMLALVPLVVNLLKNTEGFTELTTKFFKVIEPITNFFQSILNKIVNTGVKFLDKILDDTGTIVKQGEEAQEIKSLNSLDIETIQLRQIESEAIRNKKQEDYQKQTLEYIKGLGNSVGGIKDSNEALAYRVDNKGTANVYR